jgi:hypothetical protein
MQFLRSVLTRAGVLGFAPYATWLPDLTPHGRAGFDFAGIAYLPSTLLGSILGLACFKRLNDRQFALAVDLLLVVSGLGLLV